MIITLTSFPWCKPKWPRDEFNNQSQTLQDRALGRRHGDSPSPWDVRFSGYGVTRATKAIHLVPSLMEVARLPILGRHFPNSRRIRINHGFFFTESSPFSLSIIIVTELQFLEEHKFGATAFAAVPELKFLFWQHKVNPQMQQFRKKIQKCREKNS